MNLTFWTFTKQEIAFWQIWLQGVVCPCFWSLSFQDASITTRTVTEIRACCTCEITNIKEKVSGGYGRCPDVLDEYVWIFFYPLYANTISLQMQVLHVLSLLIQRIGSKVCGIIYHLWKMKFFVLIHVQCFHFMSCLFDIDSIVIELLL